jgi:hypothetical protein
VDERSKVQRNKWQQIDAPYGMCGHFTKCEAGSISLLHTPLRRGDGP